MARRSARLTDLYQQFLDRLAKYGRPLCDSVYQRDRRSLARLEARGIVTLADLLRELPGLPQQLTYGGLRLLQLTEPPAATGVLLQLMENEKYRLMCAHILGSTETPRAIRHLVAIGQSQVASSAPDLRWLEAIVRGFKSVDNPAAVEILIAVYEREDLPGWLRGDAGDALGCASQLRDRRTRQFRRVWNTALNGLGHSDIEVQFWSMYVIMQLAQRNTFPVGKANDIFRPALPLLRRIARDDHRLAPGYWWPMCEEAKDAIYVIQHGNGRENDAAERCAGSQERGEMVKRY